MPLVAIDQTIQYTNAVIYETIREVSLFQPSLKNAHHAQQFNACNKIKMNTKEMCNMNILVWNENRHEQTNETVREVYPEGIHGAIQAFLKETYPNVETATLDEPEHGLTEDRKSVV